MAEQCSIIMIILNKCGDRNFERLCGGGWVVVAQDLRWHIAQFEISNVSENLPKSSCKTIKRVIEFTVRKEENWRESNFDLTKLQIKALEKPLESLLCSTSSFHPTYDHPHSIGNGLNERRWTNWNGIINLCLDGKLAFGSQLRCRELTKQLIDWSIKYKA